MDDEHRLSERMREAEKQIAGLHITVYGNGNTPNALVSQVGLVRTRTHDLANAIQAVEGKIVVAVQDRDHALERITEDLERHKEDCMSKDNAQELVKAIVAEMRGSGDRRLNMWLVFAGVLITSTIGPLVIALVKP